MNRSLRNLAFGAVLCGQLLASLVGAAGVICIGPGGHAVIELAHAGTCEELTGAGGESLRPRGEEPIAGGIGFDMPGGGCDDSDLSLSSAAPGFGRQVMQPDVAVHLPCGDCVSSIDAESAAAVGWSGERAAAVRAGRALALLVPLVI